VEGEPLPGKGHLVLNPSSRLKKHYLLRSRTHNSLNYGRDGRGLLNAFKATTTDAKCQILSAKPTDGPTCNKWQEAVHPPPAATAAAGKSVHCRYGTELRVH
jgi:hypothetical protein